MRAELHEPVTLRARDHLVGRQLEVHRDVLEKLVHQVENLQDEHVLPHIVPVLVDHLHYLLLTRFHIFAVPGQLHRRHRAAENRALITASLENL